MIQTRTEALEVAVERIYERSDETPDGCRIWNGPLNGSGYAVVRIPGGHGTTTAHRAVYEWAHGGPLPVGTQVDHTCHGESLATCTDGGACLHRRCVQIGHLELVSPAENGSRGMRAQSTECKRGHEFTPENTWTRHDGRRHCRACNRDRARSRLARLRAA